LIRKIKFFRICFILFLLSWLFVGIKKDDEFGEFSLFLKYKPTTQIYFASPLGMQDMPENYPLNLREQEAVYDDFVNTKHYSQHGFFQFIPDLLLLGFLMTFIIALFQLMTQRKKRIY
jgi:hypothetical protein